MMVVAAPVATNLSRRFPAAVAFRCGALLAAVALALFAVAHEDAWTLYLGAAILGLAYGLAFASLGGLVVGAVDPAADRCRDRHQHHPAHHRRSARRPGRGGDPGELDQLGLTTSH
jgi:MFS family permease